MSSWAFFLDAARRSTDPLAAWGSMRSWPSSSTQLPSTRHCFAQLPHTQNPLKLACIGSHDSMGRAVLLCQLSSQLVVGTPPEA